MEISGYTTREIAEREGVSERLVRLWTRNYKWQIIATLGRTKVYAQDDVADFFQARKRRDLLRRAGWSDGRPGQGLVWYDDLDQECPKCGGFAIEKPPTTPEEAQETPPLFCEKCGLVR